MNLPTNKIIAAIRLKEIVGKSGFFYVGLVYAFLLNDIKINYPSIIVYSLIIYIGGIGIYALNAFAEYDSDNRNYRLKKLSFLKKEGHLKLAAICIFIANGLAFLLSPYSMAFTLGISILWSSYSLPKSFLKGIPFGGISTAYIGQGLHFLFSWNILSPINNMAIAFAIFFAFLNAAGHAIHEIIDYDSDLYNNIQTTAVNRGIHFNFIITQVLFFIATIYMTFLILTSLVPVSSGIIYIICYFAQLLFYFKLKNSIFIYRRAYMAVYALGVIFTFLILITQHGSV